MNTNDTEKSYYNHSRNMHFNEETNARELSTASNDNREPCGMISDDGTFDNNDRTTPRSVGGESHRDYDNDDGSEKQRRERAPMTPKHDRQTQSPTFPTTISMIMLPPNKHQSRPPFEDLNEAYHQEVSTMPLLGNGTSGTAANLDEESPRACKKRGRFLVWPTSVMFDEVS